MTTANHDSPSPAGLRGAVASLTGQPLYWLLAAMPVAVVLDWMHVGPLWIFAVSGLAIIPLAGVMGCATENLAQTLGEGIGGLLNASFGNAAELLIALMILTKGPATYPLVKASITGSIIGNTVLEMIVVLLSVLVLAMICQDGESHWMEGVMLLGVYVIVALAFYHLPDNIP